MLTTLRSMFARIFKPRDILSRARETGAVKRLRDIHPASLCLAIISCAMGDETRSIAAARRMFFNLTGYMPEESSFFDRFTAPLALLMRQLLQIAWASISVVQQQALQKALGETVLRDLLAVDASQIALPKSAVNSLPSTHPDHGGVKLTAVLSVLYQRVRGVILTDAKTHDRKALKLPRWLHGILMLLDRGYTDHRLWANIEDRKGFFLIPLKSTIMPLITAIRSGLGQAHVGKVLSGELPYRGIVDVDASFRLRKGGRRTFRVVCVPVCCTLPDGSWEETLLWFVTNLPPDKFSPEQIAVLYRFRWEVEQLFRTLKMVGRLDQLRSANENVIHAFIYGTLIGMALAHDICAKMRLSRPDVEPSFFRVLSLLLGNLPNIIDAIGTHRQTAVLQAFVNALWREGVNPNPGRPYKSSRYAREFNLYA